ncbi:MAG: response regulator [Pseudomonadota bacterium]
MGSIYNSRSTRKTPLRVLYIDDEEDNLEVFQLHCSERWRVRTLLNAEPLYNGSLSIDDFDIVFLDLVFLDPKDRDSIKRPDPSGGFAVLKWLSDHRPKMPVLIVTGIVDPVLKGRLERIGTWIRYCEKPVSFSQVGFMAMVEEFVNAIEHPLTI